MLFFYWRSPHGFAETSMYQMIQALSREKFDLLSKRGLENGSNHQTFSILLTSELSKLILKITSSIDQV